MVNLQRCIGHALINATLILTLGGCSNTIVEGCSPSVKVLNARNLLYEPEDSWKEFFQSIDARLYDNILLVGKCRF